MTPLYVVSRHEHERYPGFIGESHDAAMAYIRQRGYGEWIVETWERSTEIAGWRTVSASIIYSGSTGAVLEP